MRPVRADAEVLEHPRHHHQSGDPDDDVDHVGDGSGAEDLLHEIELEETDQTPVQGSYHHDREPHGLEALDDVHRFLLRCDGLCETSRCTSAARRGYTTICTSP